MTEWRFNCSAQNSMEFDEEFKVEDAYSQRSNVSAPQGCHRLEVNVSPEWIFPV